LDGTNTSPFRHLRRYRLLVLVNVRGDVRKAFSASHRCIRTISYLGNDASQSSVCKNELKGRPRETKRTLRFRVFLWCGCKNGRSSSTTPHFSPNFRPRILVFTLCLYVHYNKVYEMDKFIEKHQELMRCFGCTQQRCSCGRLKSLRAYTCSMLGTHHQ